MLHCGESHFLDGGSFLPAGLEPCLAQAVNAHTLDILIQMPGCANAVLLPDMAADAEGNIYFTCIGSRLTPTEKDKDGYLGVIPHG